MAFAIYLHRDNFQPEEPLILDKNITAESNVNFTFVDFVPCVIKRSGTVIPQCEVQYHTFREKHNDGYGEPMATEKPRLGSHKLRDSYSAL
ncbi:unnamed protein product [Oppiella nova]|uniref:Uncharacterized protein n=1 Tax=Oppiella nova TaxID=334625 RepID=A0A7R9QID7_9ACAR|nr:unnamed protein product [Oppiella nova]CAG2165955.1 unnamed protein product [Oppiella nova]